MFLIETLLVAGLATASLPSETNENAPAMNIVSDQMAMPNWSHMAFRPPA